MRSRAVGDDAAESPAVPGDEPVERIDQPSCPGRPERPTQGPRELHLCKQSSAAALIARDRRAVPQDEPPAVVPRLLGNGLEQWRRLGVGERKQGELLAAVEPRDDTRREPAEPSGAGVEKDRALETRRHPSTTACSSRADGAAAVRQGVAATKSPLAAVRAATTAIAALAPAASATTPARSAPSANPASRQKR